MNPDQNQSQSTPPPATTSGLQFDKAEIAAEPVLICAACKTPIAGEYYQANNQVICRQCREQWARHGVGANGIDAARVGLAVGAGIVAAIAGCVLYVLVTALTGINLGLLAIVVGWLVGNAVRWASKYQGGLIYQVIAVAITYAGVCAIYLPSLDNFWRSFAEALTAPFNGNVSIIGWVIIAFALYEASRLNRKITLEIRGPFFTRQTTPPAAT